MVQIGADGRFVELSLDVGRLAFDLLLVPGLLHGGRQRAEGVSLGNGRFAALTRGFIGRGGCDDGLGLALFDHELDLGQLVARQTLPQADQLVDLDFAVQETLVALPLLENAVVVQILGLEFGVGYAEHGEFDVFDCGTFGQAGGVLFRAVYLYGQFVAANALTLCVDGVHFCVCVCVL